MQKFTVGQSDAGGRADVFVASKYPQFTRSSLELLFDNKLVTLNGKPAKAAAKLSEDDELTVDETFLKAKPPKVNLPVIYEDSEVLVVNKPARVLTHSKGALNLEATVASFAESKLNDKRLTGNRAGVVHRLDRDTSGVIILAKTAEALSKLQKQFSVRKAKKIYKAVVEGRLEPVAAIIDAPIMRNPAKPQTFKVGSSGKPAQTEYRVIKSFEKDGQSFSLVELRPKTGRTHQLRVHMAYVNHPIVGDRVYGHNGHSLLLHAESLEITLPTGQRRVFTAPLPERIKEYAGV